jgi:hypothetical protein
MKASRVSRWPGFVVALFALAIAPPIRASDPSPRVAPPPGVSGGAVFGIIATDSAGKPYFVRSDSVPNVEGQAYGWFIGVGDSRLPVKWVETLTLPAPPASWRRDGSLPTPKMSISPDQRSGVVEGEAVPEFGVIYHFWAVAHGDPAGLYTIVVRIEDGREERFSFALQPPLRREIPRRRDAIGERAAGAGQSGRPLSHTSTP